MNKKDKKRIIESVVEQHKEVESLYDDMEKILGIIPEGRFSTTMFCLFDKHLDFAAELLGDEEEWLAWYIWDNNCGADKGLVKVNGKEKRIKNIDDLISIMPEKD